MQLSAQGLDEESGGLVVLEVEDDPESCEVIPHTTGPQGVATVAGSAGHLMGTTIQDVDELMNHSIEVDSNNRMRSDYVDRWSLRFRDHETEERVSSY